MATDLPPETPSQKVFRKAFGYFAKHDRPVLGYSGGAENWSTLGSGLPQAYQGGDH